MTLKEAYEDADQTIAIWRRLPPGIEARVCRHVAYKLGVARNWTDIRTEMVKRLTTPDYYSSKTGAVWEPPPVPPPTIDELAEREHCRELERKILKAELDPKKFWDLKPR